MLQGKPGVRQNHGAHLRATPRTRHLTWIAGGHVYGLYEAGPGWGSKWKEPRGVMQVHDLEGKRVAENVLPIPTWEGEKLDWAIRTRGGDKPGKWDLSYGSPFAIFGDCIYIRSSGFLYCISRK